MVAKKINKKFEIGSIDIDNPIEALAEAITEYGYEMGLLQKYYRLMSNAKIARDRKKANLFLLLKDTEIQDNGRAWSNDMVEMGILDDPEYQQILDDFTTLDIKYQEQEAIVTVLDKKIEILRTAAASRRSEFNHHMK
jgi:hypothetical protein